MQQQDLASDRWQAMSVVEQFANIGSEVGRAVAAYEANNKERSQIAFDRALELFDLTISSPLIRSSARREAVRAREVFVDFFYGGNSFATSREQWERYFIPFAVLANSTKAHRSGDKA